MLNNISFGDPFGLWALLAIPVILTIHLLQRRRRQHVISTQFLLPHLAPQSIAGKRIDKIRSSIPLFLQLLAALAIALLLAEPSVLREMSHQHIFLVIDSSASMQASSNLTLQELDVWCGEAEQNAAHTTWTAVESDETRPTLYDGAVRNELASALTEWKPFSGTHDPTPVLLRCRARAAPQDRVLFVTDYNAVVPAGVEVFSIARPLENAGFAGVNILEEGARWEALLKNHGTKPCSRKWWIEADGKTSASEEIRIEPGGMVIIRGAFPAPQIIVHLDEDGFTLDDSLPLVRPSQKILRAGTRQSVLGSALLASFPNVITDPAAGEAQLVIAGIPNEEAIPRSPFAVVHPIKGDDKRSIRTVPIVSERHSLTTDLDWHGLLVPQTSSMFSLKEGDKVLLWSGGQPIIFLRSGGDHAALFVNFDPELSNAPRHPAFVLLIHRFLEYVRDHIIYEESSNFETGEEIIVAADAKGPPMELRNKEKKRVATAGQPSLFAPMVPGFFTIFQGERKLLNGASYFADVRECDLSLCAPSGRVDPKNLSKSSMLRSPLAPPASWMLIAIVCCVAYWSYPWRTVK